MLYLFKPTPFKPIPAMLSEPGQKKFQPHTNFEEELQTARHIEEAERDNKNGGEKEQDKENRSDIKKQPSPLRIYQTLADSEKNAEAQYRVAEIFLKQGDLSLAFYYMKLAADQDHRMAQCRLGEMYYVEKDEATAIKWFIKADENKSDHSCARARTYLGVMRCMDQSSTQNMTEGWSDLLQAERSYQSQIDMLRDKTSFNLETINQLNLLTQEERSFGVDVGDDSYYLQPATVLPTALYLLSKKYFAMKNEEKGKHYLKLAAEAEHPLAIFLVQNPKQFTKTWNYLQVGSNESYEIARIYFEGEYVVKDILQAINYFKQAAKAGHTGSAVQLGEIYSSGKDVTKDISQAITYFKQAADAGHTYAALRVGQLYIDKSYYKLAEKYLNLAFADHELTNEAAISLYELYDTLRVSAWSYLIDYQTNWLKYCQLAADAGHTNAQFNLPKSKSNSIELHDFSDLKTG